MPHAPLGWIVNGGYTWSTTISRTNSRGLPRTYERGVNAWYSLGFSTADLTIQDVLIGSPAFGAGCGPGMRLIAINGSRATDELLHNAIRDASADRPH